MFNHLRFFRWNVDTIFRLIADALIIAISLFLATLTASAWAVYTGAANGTVLQHWLPNAGTYVLILAALEMIGLSVFVSTGFYTRGRAYRGRYKALFIFQAVTLTYMSLTFALYLYPQELQLPQSVFFLGWAFTLAAVLSSRLLTAVLKWVVHTDKNSSGSASLLRVPERVAVIGGAGYIGSLLLPRLLEQGYRVRVLDLMLFGEETIKNVLHHPNLEVLRADYRQIDKLVEVMQGADTAIHLGGIVGDPACSYDEELTIDVNITSTRVLGEVARGNGVRRLIFASSCSVYGASDSVLDECSKLSPVSLYARSKIASERVLSELATDEFAPVFLRFGTVFGLSGRTRFDLVVNLLTAKALIDGEITVFGPDQWRPFVHVDDVAEAVKLSLAAPVSAVAGEAFNIGSNDMNYTIGQVGELIHQKIPEAKLIVGGMDGDLRNYRVNFDKAERILGFKPQWTLEEGIDEVAAAVRSGGIVDYSEPQYSNVKHLMNSEDSQTRLVKRIYSDGWEQRMLQDVG